MRRLLALTCGFALLSGCSVLGMQPVPRPLPEDTYPQCSETVAPVAFDILLGVVGGLVVTGQVKDHPDIKSIAMIGVPSALFLGSGIYGVVTRNRCVAARAEAERTIKRPY
jgi:hypothetical protein